MAKHRKAQKEPQKLTHEEGKDDNKANKLDPTRPKLSTPIVLQLEQALTKLTPRQEIDQLVEEGGTKPIKGIVFIFSIKLTEEYFKCGGVDFDDCTFEEDICFCDLELIKSISFNKCTFKKKIKFINFNENKGLDVHDSNYPSLYFYDCTFSDFSISKCKFRKSLHFEKCRFDDFIIEELEIEAVNGEIKLKECTFFKDFNFRNIDISKSIPLHGGDFKIDDCIFNCEKVKLLNINAKTLKFHKVQKANEIQIGKCKLGLLDFNESNFEDEILIMEFNEI